MRRIATSLKASVSEMPTRAKVVLELTGVRLVDGNTFGPEF